jgi:putative pyruvate formate lyase activating enzyme
MSLDEVVNAIIPLLDQGCKAVGFVSPTHFIPHVKAIIDSLRSIGRTPVFVYNTNCYDKAEEIRGLESYIDVYLPDFKYAESGIAKDYSSAPDYPEVALAALREMYRQKGSTLILDDSGQVESGLIIRHLILPGSIENSIDVLRLIADKLSESVTLSLMAQYWPVPVVKDHPHLGRNINSVEYKRVVDEMEKLGFYKGWVQELESHSNYRPDFLKDHPFEI